MRFQNQGRLGIICLDKGDVVHAQLDRLTGEAAASEILAWPPVEFTFGDGVEPPVRTLKTSWDQLLRSSNLQQREAMSADLQALPPWDGLESVDGPVAAAGPKIDTSANQPRIIVYGDKIEGRTYELNLPVMHLGRGPLNEIIVPDPSVSTRHCMFLLAGGHVTVRDLHSSNGTFVNGQQVTEAQLDVNDVIRVGAVIVKFEVALRRPKLRPDPTLPLSIPADAPAAMVPAPAPGWHEGSGAPPGNAPISYAAIARDIRRDQENWRPPTWLTLALLIFFVLLGYLIVGNPTWIPSWARFW